MRLRPDLCLRAGVLAAVTALSTVVPSAHAANRAAQPPCVLDADVVPGTGRISHLGELPHAAYLRLAFTLVARNRPDLDAYVADAADPSSPRYRRYLRASQFAGRYGRTPGEIERLRTYLAGNGFHIDDVHSGRLVVDASATAADVERTFAIRLDTWRDAATGWIFYGNATPPKLPADPGALVADIAGLTDRAVREPGVRLGPDTGLGPRELRTGDSLAPLARGESSGSRLRVALVEFAQFRPQDVARYDRRFASASPEPELRLVDGGPEAGHVGREAAEAEIETVQTMAPTAATVVFSAEDSPAGEVDAFQGVVDAGITVAMTGWGAPEGQRTGSGMRAIDLVMEEGAAEGVGFYAASADPGPSRTGAGAGVDFPASDPYVTAVGSADETGSGRAGGSSAVFAQPWWQVRRGRADPGGRREVPDVTVRVDPGQAVYADGRWRTADGAGIATALWAASAARHDQLASSCGEQPQGFAAPTVYRQAAAQPCPNRSRE